MLRRSRLSMVFLGMALPFFLGDFLVVASQAEGVKKGSVGVVDLSQQYLSGAKVTTREGLAPYTGRDAWKRLVGENRQEAYRLNFRQLGINYGDTVDFQLRQEQVLLCPQTVDFLYGQFTPTTVRYQKGSRPELEKVVARVTAGCKTEREKVLALMRFCRDLYKKREGIPFTEYIYGGTEEQLVEKGEELCECLGRLMVALCEVAGIPGRVVMHDIGGHITSEILVDGNWAYIDPRAGLYFLKEDGSFASTWDLWQNPSLLMSQSETVLADVSDRWTAAERIWKCVHLFFNPLEVNGFQNYSLADAGRYNYTQKSYKQASDDGLFVINKKYVQVIDEVFGLTGDGLQHCWDRQPLRPIELAYRNDGFSQFFYDEPPMTKQKMLDRFVNPLGGTNVGTLYWGLGPGSVFCFDTKVGQVFGAPLSEEQWKMMRLGDRRVYDNVMSLIDAGHCPLRLAVERGRELGLKVIARLEMNHEYGPASSENWMWVGFVGDFNKNHPEYRVKGSVRLDFKHKAVRDFKLAILREAAVAGADGVSMDLAVYPPFFTKPDPAIMTQFVRDVRAMLDEVGREQNRRLELHVRFRIGQAIASGLDWKTWMKQRLIDYAIPTLTSDFDIDVGEVVSLGHRTGVKVMPTLWQSLGLVDTDELPGDERQGRRRYTKPKTQGMFFAQAILCMRQGADGVQLGFPSDEWRPWMSDMADPTKIEFADKQYMVNTKHGPIRFSLEEEKRLTEKTVPLRIGDDLPGAKQAGYRVEAELVLFGNRAVEASEKLAVYVNGQGPATIGPLDKQQASDATPVTSDSDPMETQVYDQHWWRRGVQTVSVNSDWLRMGENEIRFVYTADGPPKKKSLTVKWIDLKLDYQAPKKP